MNAFTIGETLLSLLPKIFQVIQTVEADAQAQQVANPQGSAKLAFALGLLQAYYETTNPTVPFAEMEAAVTKVIATVVAAYHSYGVFVKKPA